MKHRRSRLFRFAPLWIPLLAGLPLLAQDFQLQLDQQRPRPLDILPPAGLLRLEASPSTALSFRFSQNVWAPREGQALELTVGLRLPSERQLTFRNSTGASGDVSARLRLELQPALGALYRFAHPFGLPLEAGLGMEARREKLVMKDGGLESAGTLNRVWLRGVLRHPFQSDGYGPYLALEWALPITSAPTPTGIDYLADLDHLGSSSNPGTSAKAHAPVYGVALAVGYRFGRPVPAITTRTTDRPPESPLRPLERVLPQGTTPSAPAVVPALAPQAAPIQAAPIVLPHTIVLDEAALHFALDRSDLPAQGGEVLRAWATRIKTLAHPPAITVTGYSDATGKRPHNLRLSRARAEAVAKALTVEGLKVVRIEGLGPDQPVATNTTVEGRAQNRRVELHLEGEGIEVKSRTDSDLVAESAGQKAKPRGPKNPPSKKQP